MRLIRKLLRKHISFVQLAGFFIANFIGVIVILSGVQIYQDIKPLLVGDKPLFGKDFVVVSKPVKVLGDSTFDKEEIEDLSRQPFVKSWGEFISSQYRVDATIDFSGRSLTTHMFFESVPDHFLDIDPEVWRFDEQKGKIPIILPRNYINLYNFGFSTARNLPQITEQLMQSIKIQVRLHGNNMYDRYAAEIVAFTDDINTILVPESFMMWANDYYAPGSQDKSSRLIVEVDNPTDKRITQYINEHGYQTEGKEEQASKAMFLLKVCVGIIVGIGSIFSILSIFILTLSIYLLVEKNSEKLQNLTLIGYTPAKVARPYTSLSIILNVAIVALALAVVHYIRGVYTTRLADLFEGVGESSMWLTILSGVAIAAVIILFNAFVIRRKINALAKKR